MTDSNLFLEALTGRKASYLANNTAVTEMPSRMVDICTSQDISRFLELASHHVDGATPRLEPKMVLAGLT